MLLTILTYRTPSVMTELMVMALTMLLVTALAGAIVVAIAVVAAIPTTFWIGVAVTLAYAAATYPRKEGRK